MGRDDGVDLVHAGAVGLLGVEAVGVLIHVAHEPAGEGLTELGGVVHLAGAVGDGLGDLVVGHAGGAVKHQGNLQAGANLLEDALLDVRGPLVDAVGGAHADGEGGAVSAGNELLGLVGVGVGVLALDGGAVVLLAADLAELGLDGVPMGPATLVTEAVRAMLSSKGTCEPSIMTEV